MEKFCLRIFFKNIKLLQKTTTYVSGEGRSGNQDENNYFIALIF